MGNVKMVNCFQSGASISLRTNVAVITRRIKKQWTLSIQPKIPVISVGT